MKTVRIAAAQTVEFWEDIEAALNCVADFAARAETEGAALLCSPESFPSRLSDRRRCATTKRSGPHVAHVQSRAEPVPEDATDGRRGAHRVQDGRLFNTAIVVDRGTLIGRYRKAHLFSGEHIFDAGSGNKVRLFGSENCFDTGSDSHVFEVDGLRFGINICYDTNFPEAARRVADLGASLVVCPANNMCRRKTAQALKNVHNTVRGERCRETGLWLVSADVTGERDGSIS
jgi:predicted amidohydrolase